MGARKLARAPWSSIDGLDYDYDSDEDWEGYDDEEESVGGDEDEADDEPLEEDDGFVMADDVVLLEDGTEQRTQRLPQRSEARRRLPVCGCVAGASDAAALTGRLLGGLAQATRRISLKQPHACWPAELSTKPKKEASKKSAKKDSATTAPTTENQAPASAVDGETAATEGGAAATGAVASQAAAGKPARAARAPKPLPSLLLDCVRAVLGRDGHSGTKKEVTEACMTRFQQDNPDEPRPSRAAFERGLAMLAEKKNKGWRLVAANQEAPGSATKQASLDMFRATQVNDDKE